MNDYKIVIDAGHGGDDPGASGNGIIEKDKTLEISNYMYNRLKNLGYDVAITRATDETLNPTQRVQRILAPYGSGDDVIVISNHINAGGADGAEVIYALRDDSKLSNLILEQFEKIGQNTRKAYQRRLPSNTSKDYYFIHRDTGNTQPIIVEYGFLDGNGDDASQLKNNWRTLTDAVINGIVNYTNNNPQGYYVVKPGDTLWAIARDNNTTASEIKSLNNLTTNNLSIGQLLKLPMPKQEDDENIYNENVYIVKSGDSLYSIAREYNTTVSELKTLNNLSSNVLSIGQRLKLPVKTATGNTYTVKSGDSLYSIARLYNTTVSDLMSLNNLTSTTLSIGQVLSIPSKSQTSDTSENIYTVKSGDNLYSIARQYNTTVSEIMNYNGLTSNLLSIGQMLKIPSVNQEGTKYTVKSGDSLYSIAKRYNTTVNDIKSKNNLTSNMLSIGQVLII